MTKNKAKRNRSAKRAVKSTRSEAATQGKISVSRSAAVSMREGEKEGEKVFRAVLSTENKVLELDGNRLVERVLMMDGITDMPGQLPMFDQHNPSSALHRLGSIRDIQVNGDSLEGDLNFADTDDGKNAHALYRDGHLTDVSIGAIFLRSDMKQVAAGKSAEFMGRSFEAHPRIPLQIVTRWTPIEVSAVNRGADQSAKVKRMFEEINNVGDAERKEVDMDFHEWLKRKEVDHETLSEEQRAGWQKLYDADKEAGKVAEEKTERKAVEKPVDIKSAISDAMKETRADEQKRIAAIRAEAEGISEETVNRCITDGLTVEDSRAEFLTEMRKSRKSVGSPYIHVDSGEINREHFEASLLMSAGMSDVAEKEYDKEVVDRADKKLRGAGIDELCRWSLARDGEKVPLNRREVIKRGFSTLSLPVALGNVANKSLLKGFNYTEPTWQKWCFTDEVADFKTNTRVNYSSTGNLSQVGPGGKIKSSSGTETSESFRIHTYADMFTLTREQAINDDLGVLTHQPEYYGREALDNLSDLVYTALLANGTMGGDGYALFGTDHDNYISGTTSLLDDANGIDAVSDALVKFMTMKSLSGRSINVAPKYLLVPPQLRAFAQNLFQSPQVLGLTTKKAPTTNIHAGSYEVITETRLSNSAYTGYSTTAWYLMADPNIAQTMGVFFLRGQRSPTIERVPVDSDTLGLSWRVYHDAGVKAMEYRGGVKSAGA